MPKAMILTQYREYGDLGGLALADVPEPVLAEGEVLIDVDAFALNYGDFALFANKYTFDLELPARVGDECSGTVKAVGPGVTRVKVGDRVGTLPIRYGKYGVNGEFAVYPAAFVARYPDNLTVAEACSIWVCYLTCYFALYEIGKVKEGDFVLITAASSSAGMAAMELCKMQGAKAIGTSRTRSNCDHLLNIGFDHVIAQDEDDLASQVLDFSGGLGVRLVYDPIGGKIVQDYATALAQDAIIFLYGGMSQTPTVLPVIELVNKAACLRPFSVYNHIYDEASRERAIKFIYDALSRGHLQARVEKEFPLSQYKEALQYQFQSTRRRGKIVISTKSVTGS